MQKQEGRGGHVGRLLICAAALAALMVSVSMLRTTQGGPHELIRAWVAPLQFNAVTLADVR